MSSAFPRVIELTEFQPLALAPDELSPDMAATIHERYADHVEIKPPWPGAEPHWLLKALGWVGYIPLSPTLLLALRPKVPLQNLFGMLEYAYQTELKQLGDKKALADCADLREFYTRLAHVLARRVLDRERKGLHRAYLGRRERLPVVVGRPDIARSLSHPWEAQLECEFEEHTADVEDNQLLAWTLRHVAQSGLCAGAVAGAVRQAWRGLQGSVTLRPFSAAQCLGRIYDRLNRDYEVLHALCRFFLENSVNPRRGHISTFYNCEDDGEAAMGTGRRQRERIVECRDVTPMAPGTPRGAGGRHLGAPEHAGRPSGRAGGRSDPAVARREHQSGSPGPGAGAGSPPLFHEPAGSAPRT